MNDRLRLSLPNTLMNLVTSGFNLTVSQKIEPIRSRDRCQDRDYNNDGQPF